MFYALIGGRSIPNLNDFSLEEKIFKELNLTPKKILFIPLACYPNYEDAIQKFKALVPKSYTIEVVTEYDDFKRLNTQMISADVIYFSGGCAEELVKLSRRYGIDLILKNMGNQNKLIMGISAGAILLSRYGMGDRYSYKDANHIYNYQMVEGLGCLDITICPHYDHDGLDCFNSEVKEYKWNGYALEDDTAILFTPKVKAFKLSRQKSVYFYDASQEFLMQALYEEVK